MTIGGIEGKESAGVGDGGKELTMVGGKSKEVAMVGGIGGERGSGARLRASATTF